MPDDTRARARRARVGFGVDESVQRERDAEEDEEQPEGTSQRWSFDAVCGAACDEAGRDQSDHEPDDVDLFDASAGEGSRPGEAGGGRGSSQHFRDRLPVDDPPVLRCEHELHRFPVVDVCEPPGCGLALLLLDALAHLDQCEDAGCEVVRASGAGSLRRSEHCALPVDVDRGTLHHCCADFEVDVSPREAEYFADPPALHEEQCRRGTEPVGGGGRDEPPRLRRCQRPCLVPMCLRWLDRVSHVRGGKAVRHRHRQHLTQGHTRVRRGLRRQTVPLTAL